MATHPNSSPGSFTAKPVPPQRIRAAYPESARLSEQVVWAGFVLLLLAWSLLYPPLNWPDEAYKISTLYDTENLYLNLVDFLQGRSCSVAYSLDPTAYFGSNRLSAKIISGDGCYSVLKLINVGIIVLLSAVFALFLNKEKRFIYLLSICWPASLFYLTSVNNQVVFHIVSVMIGVALAFGGNRMIALVVTILLLPIDRSFIGLALFLMVHQAMTYSRTLVIVGALLFVALFSLFSPLIQAILDVLFGPGGLAFDEIVASNDRYRDNFLVSIAILVTSFVYLGGLSAVFGFGLDYLLFAGYAARRFVALKDKTRVINDVVALLITMAVILQAIPTIATFRYYVFIFPILFVSLVPKRHWTYYFVYCWIASAIYLVMANTFQSP